MIIKKSHHRTLLSKIKMKRDSEHKDVPVAKHQHGMKNIFLNVLNTKETAAFGAEGRRKEWSRHKQQHGRKNNPKFVFPFLFVLQCLKKLKQSQTRDDAMSGT